MASPASLPDAIERISGVIPLSQTLGLWQSMLIAAALILVSMAISYYSAPGDAEARGMKEMGVDISARHAEDRHAADARRVARIQSVPDHRRLHARIPVSDPGSRGQRSLDHSRAEPLRLSVPDRRDAAALASAVVRAGDPRVGDPGRRRADPVPVVCGHRAHDDRVRHRDADGALLRGRSRRRTPTR